jgi:hypothetical protein
MGMQLLRPPIIRNNLRRSRRGHTAIVARVTNRLWRKVGEVLEVLANRLGVDDPPLDLRDEMNDVDGLIRDIFPVDT